MLHTWVVRVNGKILEAVKGVGGNGGDRLLTKLSKYTTIHSSTQCVDATMLLMITYLNDPSTFIITSLKPSSLYLTKLQIL